MRVPLSYNGDALLHATFIKGIIDNGWYWQNNYIGAPGGLKMYDYPAVDTVPILIIKFITLFTSNPFLALNLFYLLTFPFVTISALFVFRQFNFSYGTSLVSSLLYTFMPYHFMRGESHLFLSAYYLVPLVVMVLLWVVSGKLFRSDTGEGSTPGLNLTRHELVLSIVICILVGSSGLYYPFFSCFFLFIAGVLAYARFKSLRAVVPAAVLTGVIVVTTVINVSPTLYYRYKHGDAGVTLRGPSEAETYSLKIAQLVLPITGHRIGALRVRKDLYNTSPLVNENDTASLGFVGTIGFVALFAFLFLGSRRNVVDPAQPGTLLHDLSLLNLAAVLLGTIGGIGSLVAYLAFPGIRSYNRISIFIGFFALFAFSIGTDRILGKIGIQTTRRLAFFVALLFLLVLGVLDQTGRHNIPNYNEVNVSFSSDAAFVENIERVVPGGMIFQLPYVPFPEYPRFNRMIDYDHFRGYLHSHRLRWSYGVMKLREWDRWQRELIDLPTNQFVEALAFSGFHGLYVDRNGYGDNGQSKEAELSGALGVSPTVSPDGRLVFFDMTSFNQRLRQQHSQDWAQQQDLALHPLFLDWGGGFSGLESSGDKTWHWSSETGELRFSNNAERPRTVTLDMAFATGHKEESDLVLSGLISEQLKVNDNPRAYSKTITIPPGSQVIRFTSNARRVDAPLDPRVLIFRIENFRLAKLD